MHNLLSPLGSSSLLHVEVHFGEKAAPKLSSQLDAAIGRAAHIAYLDNLAFTQMFVAMYLGYFV